MAVVVLDALVPLCAKVTVPGPVADHVYRTCCSPPSSSPSTSSVMVGPREGLGDAVGGVTTNGGMSLTVTVALAWTAPTDAVTTKEPMVPPAWKLPAASTVPPPLAVHANVGGVVNA